jgi:hypothetical protein
LTNVPGADSSRQGLNYFQYFNRETEVDSTYKNVASGEFTPGKGFDLVRTRYGSLKFQCLYNGEVFESDAWRANLAGSFGPKSRILWSE